MKTKEIDVWVGTNLDEVDTSYSMLCYTDLDCCQSSYHNAFKAKLIIEIPEKKIEITESEYEDLLHIKSKYEDLC